MLIDPTQQTNQSTDSIEHNYKINLLTEKPQSKTWLIQEGDSEGLPFDSNRPTAESDRRRRREQPRDRI